jgi:hypothetical protein
MADKYSPLWWNQQASVPLTRDIIQQLTGMMFSTKWNADKTVDYFWYTDVRNRAPGFAAAGLLIDPGAAAHDVTPFIGAADYPNWVTFVSAVGFVAPGANAPWTPALDGTAPTVQGPIAPAPTTAVGGGPLSVPPASATPPVPNSPTAPVTTMLPQETAPPQPTSNGTRTLPNVWLWLALAAAAVLAFAYFRGRD